MLLKNVKDNIITMTVFIFFGLIIPITTTMDTKMRQNIQCLNDQIKTRMVLQKHGKSFSQAFFFFP